MKLCQKEQKKSHTLTRAGGPLCCCRSCCCTLPWEVSRRRTRLMETVRTRRRQSPQRAARDIQRRRVRRASSQRQDFVCDRCCDRWPGRRSSSRGGEGEEGSNMSPSDPNLGGGWRRSSIASSGSLEKASPPPPPLPPPPPSSE